MSSVPIAAMQLNGDATHDPLPEDDGAVEEDAVDASSAASADASSAASAADLAGVNASSAASAADLAGVEEVGDASLEDSGATAAVEVAEESVADLQEEQPKFQGSVGNEPGGKMCRIVGAEETQLLV